MIYTLIATDADGLIDRAEVREALDGVLATLPAKLTGSREEWGTSPTEVAAYQAAMAQFGPAP